MRTLFTAFLATVLLAFAAALPAQAQTGVPELEKYFNSIRTMKARFVQSNPNGSVVQGTLYLRRPGRMRADTQARVRPGRRPRLWLDDGLRRPRERRRSGL